MELDRREITEVRLRNLMRGEGLAEPDSVVYAPGQITLLWHGRRVAIVVDEIPEGCVEIEDLEYDTRRCEYAACEATELLDDDHRRYDCEYDDDRFIPASDAGSDGDDIPFRARPRAAAARRRMRGGGAADRGA